MEDKIYRSTNERMTNPQTGDIFQEFYSYWVYVLERKKDSVVIQDSNGILDGKPSREMRIDDFRAFYSYGTIKGYWVMFRKNDVNRTNLFKD